MFPPYYQTMLGLKLQYVFRVLGRILKLTFVIFLYDVTYLKHRILIKWAERLQKGTILLIYASYKPEFQGAQGCQ